MDYKQRIEVIVALGDMLNNFNEEEWQPYFSKAYQENQWFTPENTRLAFKGLGQMLSRPHIDTWLSAYHRPEAISPLRIGIIMAGNIPLVGLHDWICTLLAGHHAVVKLSNDDKILLPRLVNQLAVQFPEVLHLVSFVDKLENYDAVIATGSNNTTRHFEYYFKHVPLLIRKNRHSVAVLNGSETKDDFMRLADDIFSYFGLGCRNVSKLYMPKGFFIPSFYDAIESWTDIKNHNKYANNHTFYKAINLMNLVNIYDNDFLILNEHQQVSSPVAVCHYEFYESDEMLCSQILRDEAVIQCIVTRDGLPINGLSADLAKRTFMFGQAQLPMLWDYADGVDTYTWLLSLKPSTQL